MSSAVIRAHRRRSGPLHVVLMGGFGGGSLGNDASLEALIEMVRRMYPNAVITCLCPRPEQVRRRFGIPAHPIRSPRPTGGIFSSPMGRFMRAPYRLADVWRALRVVGSFDALLIPGTGILDDYGGGRPTGWPLTLAVWFSAARIRGARTGLVSIGAGPLEHPMSRRLARLVGGLADYRSFRDPGSRDFMVSIGLDSSRCEVVPDVVFALPVSPATGSSTQRPVVVVQVMNYLGWYKKQHSASIGARHTGTLAAFCCWLLDEGYAVRLVTADGHDAPATQQVAQSVKARAAAPASRWLSTALADDLSDLAKLMADATLVVASRYHSVICALLCGKPAISIGYASKNDELMAAMGLGSYCQQIEKVDEDLLRQQFRDMVAKHGQLTAELVARVAEFRGRLTMEERRLGAILNDAADSGLPPGA